MIYGTVMIAVIYGAGYTFESCLKGEVRSWQEQFSKEQSEKFDHLYSAKMKGSGLEFDLS